MRVSELMRKRVVTVNEEEPAAAVLDLMIREHLHGVPVVNEDGVLVGMVTQQDVYFSALTHDKGKPVGIGQLIVRDIMTGPAVAVDVETSLTDLCKLMYKLRIHRVPILDDDKICGIVSSLDICAAVSRGEKLD